MNGVRQVLRIGKFVLIAAGMTFAVGVLLVMLIITFSPA